MPNVSFTNSLYLLAENGYQPKVKVEKTGTGMTDVRVYSTGGSSTQEYQEKYPDKATKRLSKDAGDFYSRTKTLHWDENEEGIKEYEITIHSDEKAEKPEYFYVTLSGEGFETDLWRCHCFVLDNDGSSFFNQYIEPPYSLKQPEAPPIPVGQKQIKPFKVAIADTNGVEYPQELLSQMPTDFFKIVKDGSQPLVQNCCEFQDLGAFTIFNGEFHLERIGIPSIEETQRYNQENNTQFSEYSHVFLELPFSNPTDVAIPLTLAASQFWMFRDMFSDERSEQVNGSMTAILLPKSNRVMFEFAKGDWKTTLCGTWTENRPTIRPSMHIFIGGIVPNA